MKDKNINLTFSDLANGAIQEKLEGELSKIFTNIHDPNTAAKLKRGITIKLDFKPDENRQIISMTSDFRCQLAPVEGVATTIITGKNFDTGKIEANELKSNVPGQTYIDPDDLQQRTDTGELIDEVEKEIEKQQQIIDLQKKRG